MYLHLGQSVVAPHADIIGIFDLDNSSWSHLTRAFLERAQREGRVTDAGGDLPRSFVLSGRGRGARVYLSPVTSATLLRRAEGNSLE